MTKTILLTGATDGIGFETVKLLAAKGHTLLLHGRSEEKLADTRVQLSKVQDVGVLETYRADLSKLGDVEALAESVTDKHKNIDVLINNAGVFKVSNQTTDEGYDIRFIVNTIAPYLLTQKLLRHIPENGRIVNLSSAAQAPVDFGALAGEHRLSDTDAYAQSKLAIIMWSAHMAAKVSGKGPAIISVNPASFLGSKMVKEAYGTAGNDLSIGADILFKAALSDAFADASGRYYDNDRGQFTSLHPDASDPVKNANLVAAMESVILRLRN